MVTISIRYSYTVPDIKSGTYEDTYTYKLQYPTDVSMHKTIPSISDYTSF
jgi:hypothetical protein